MGRLSDFDLNDSSAPTSPHADDADRTRKNEKSKAPARRALALPDPQAEPSEQLAVCERAIHEAKAAWKQASDAAMATFVDEAGPHITWVHENKLYKLLVGNNGKPYRTFHAYCQEQHDISRSSGYRIVRTVPLLNILEDADHPVSDLSTRQVQVLHPLRRQHGRDAVLDVWKTAWATKKKDVPSPEELSKAIVLRNYKVTADDDDDAELSPAVGGAVPAQAGQIERVSKILAPETIRRAVVEEPEKVVLLVKALRAALEEAGVSID